MTISANTYAPSELDTMCASKGIKIEAILIRKPLESAYYVKEIGGNINFKYVLCARKDASWEDTAFHWVVNLEYKGKKISTDFKCGLAHCETRFQGKVLKAIPPSVADVVNCLVLDSMACALSFGHWCNELGYDVDSRKAHSIYEECQKAGDKIKKLLGNEISEFEGVSH